MQTNGTEQGDRNRSDTQNKNRSAHAAEESEEEGSNNNNYVPVDLSGYVCSYIPDETNSCSPSNNQTAIKENGTTTTELRRSKRIHGAPTS